jgi:hypothetical protein
VKYNQISANPSHIYMYNARIGFVDGYYVRKITDGGNNWFPITSEGNVFSYMYFIDSLTGWKCYYSEMKKTTNGGLNWVNQQLPQGGNIYPSYMTEFSVLNKDTIWGVGGTYFFPGGRLRGIVYRTTNGGNNWHYQIPDTSINIYGYKYIKFINKRIGWVYNESSGAHTVIEGDTGFVMSNNQISSTIPNQYKLEQNYPNPFNPLTNIKYQITNNSFITLKVYNILGKEIMILVNKKQSPGTYEVKFNGSNFSSGIYFYTLFVDGNRIDSKKMLMIK